VVFEPSITTYTNRYRTYFFQCAKGAVLGGGASLVRILLTKLHNPARTKPQSDQVSASHFINVAHWSTLLPLGRSVYTH